MNRTKIEWTDWTWNPITGCKHGCWYCYAKKLCLRFKKIFPNGFEPTFHPERLKEPYELKKPSKIFVCSIADLFAPWTDEGWTNTVLTTMEICPIPHTFQMLTKNPERIMQNWIIRRLDNDTTKFIPKNWWFGTTVTGESHTGYQEPDPFHSPYEHPFPKAITTTDVGNINCIKGVPAKIRFVSFEPLLGPIDFENHSLEGIQWVIIGKLTGSRKVKLKNSWVIDILEECDFHKIPVFLKKNLGWREHRQEFPK